MLSKRFTWPIVIIVSALLSGMLAFGDTGGALRPVILFWFILVCPGMAIVRLIRLGDQVFELVLSIALSLVLSTLLAELLVLTKHWSPSAILAILIAISITGAMLQFRQPSERDVRREIPGG